MTPVVVEHAIDRAGIRARLEETRRAYHELLAAIDEAGWTRQSANPDMSVKQLMWHVAWAMGWMARSVDAVRSGNSLRAPSFLIEPGRKLAMRWLALGATREAAAHKYDEGHDALLQRLEALTVADWNLRAKRFGEERSVAWYFTHPLEHFEEHARDVRATIQRRGAQHG